MRSQWGPRDVPFWRLFPHPTCRRNSRDERPQISCPNGPKCTSRAHIGLFPMSNFLWVEHSPSEQARARWDQGQLLERYGWRLGGPHGSWVVHICVQNPSPYGQSKQWKTKRVACGPQASSPDAASLQVMDSENSNLTWSSTAFYRNICQVRKMECISSNSGLAWFITFKYLDVLYMDFHRYFSPGSCKWSGSPRQELNCLYLLQFTLALASLCLRK